MIKLQLFEKILREERLREMAVSTEETFANNVAAIVYERLKPQLKGIKNVDTANATMKQAIKDFIAYGNKVTSPFVIIGNDGYLLAYTPEYKELLDKTFVKRLG